MSTTSILSSDLVSDSRETINQNFAKVTEGPSSATDNAITRFNGTTGKSVQNSAVTVDDSGNMAGVGTLNSQTIISNRTGKFAITTTTDINDDAATSLTPPYQYGTLIISMQTDNGGGYGGVVNYTAENGGQVYTTKWAGGGNLEVSTGSLVGTTGTDAKVTVSAATDGKLYVENRVGGARAFIITLN